MITKFKTFDILQIVEKIELKRAGFYVQIALRFENSGPRDLCYSLAGRSQRYAKFWAEKRLQHSNETGDFGTFDPNDYVRSNPVVMAGLTNFGNSRSSISKFTGKESQEQILRDTIRRSYELKIFYEGLKEFSFNPETNFILDKIICSESKYINVIGNLIRRIREKNSLISNNTVTGD
jgi:hypothetical protein